MPGAPSASAASPRPGAAYMHRVSSRREPLDRPAATVARVRDAIVQAARTSLPELEVVGNHAIAAPVRRARGILPVLRGELRPAAFEPAAVLDRFALWRGPRTDARSE